MKWCAAQGIPERDQLKMASFGTQIKMRFESQKRKTGRYYLGFRLRDLDRPGCRRRLAVISNSRIEPPTR
jgi:hypothetical protein